ncbi:hypothetical protein MMC30_004262 [Trapelia coarctata]|nr:hypothetical protein [Trapelia coarctata]
MPQITSVSSQELTVPGPINPQAVMLPSAKPTESHLSFLKLPAEVRNMIYLLLLSNRTIELICSQPEKSAHDSRYQQNHAFRDTNSHIYHQPTGNGNGNSPLSISILLACSQIYNEARLLPYTNAFQIQHRVLLPFLTTRNPDQRPLIHSLTLAVDLDRADQDASVKQCFRKAAMMLKGLKYLHIIMTVNRPALRLGGNTLWVKSVGY